LLAEHSRGRLSGRIAEVQKKGEGGARSEFTGRPKRYESELIQGGVVKKHGEFKKMAEQQVFSKTMR